MPNGRGELVRPQTNERDRRGRLLRDYGQIYSYDNFDRVVEVADQNGVKKAYYLYWPGTSRVLLRILLTNNQPTLVERLVWDGDRLVEVYDVTSATDKIGDTTNRVERYIYGPDPLARPRDRGRMILLHAEIRGSTYHFQRDEMGPPNSGRLADAQGQVVQYYSYALGSQFTLRIAGADVLPERHAAQLICRVLFDNGVYDPVTFLLQRPGIWLNLRHGNEFRIGTLPTEVEDLAALENPSPQPQYITELEATRRAVLLRSRRAAAGERTLGERVGRIAKGGAVMGLCIIAIGVGWTVAIPVLAFTAIVGGATAYYNRRSQVEELTGRDADFSFGEATGFVATDTLGISGVYAVVAGEDLFFATPMSAGDRVEGGILIAMAIAGSRYGGNAMNQLAVRGAALRQARVDAGVTPSLPVRVIGDLSDMRLLTYAHRQGVNGAMQQTAIAEGISRPLERMLDMRRLMRRLANEPVGPNRPRPDLEFGESLAFPGSRGLLDLIQPDTTVDFAIRPGGDFMMGGFHWHLAGPVPPWRVGGGPLLLGGEVTRTANGVFTFSMNSGTYMLKLVGGNWFSRSPVRLILVLDLAHRLGIDLSNIRIKLPPGLGVTPLPPQ